MSKYKLNKKCLKCGRILLDKNKTGFCNIHRDRTGHNNPFYGKSHSNGTIEKIKKKAYIKSKNNWKNKEYRKKVIDSVSKPRRESFKKEQSERIKDWYKRNPIQREIRSKKMKDSWQKGKIVKNNYSCNESNMEIKLFNDIKKIAPNAKRKQKIIDKNNRYIFPDILIEDYGVIIEFFGNFWHANTNMFESDDIVYNNLKAKDIWIRDEERMNRLKEMPCLDYPNFCKEYNVIIVWEDEYKNNKKEIINYINIILNYEYSY